MARAIADTGKLRLRTVLIKSAHTAAITLEPQDNRRLAALCGQFNEHLYLIERRLGVELNNRGNVFQVIGDTASVQAAVGTVKSRVNRARNRLTELLGLDSDD